MRGKEQVKDGEREPISERIKYRDEEETEMSPAGFTPFKKNPTKTRVDDNIYVSKSQLILFLSLYVLKR